MMLGIGARDAKDHGNIARSTAFHAASIGSTLPGEDARNAAVTYDFKVWLGI